uniref:Nucleoside diphosphate kinase-like domain-containing protein n=1 Tax=Musa acuminata subsp. malaccensis TaxID=214687 RepID=A0A804I8W8_MUSAM|nr:PREDICTED: probable nucleoside diphosphate kinase 5 isoform X2 [Musa acuminata subsp. malaccensis]
MRLISVFLLHLLVILFLQSLSYAALEKERTLAMIKPDGIRGNFTNQIKHVIVQSGFVIVHEMMLQLDVRNVSLFYSEHSEKSFFPNLVEYMTSGPVLVMVIEKTNAIADWRALIGPTDAGKAKVSHPNRYHQVHQINFSPKVRHLDFPLG